MHISMRAGDKIYINGGVIRVDRKVTLELLNDMTFLLGHHVIQADQATTPLRQIYFVIQTIMMDSRADAGVTILARRLIADAIASFEHVEILSTLKHVDELVSRGNTLEAMKLLRQQFDREHGIIFPGKGVEGKSAA